MSAASNAVAELYDFVKHMREKYGGKEEWESMKKSAQAMIGMDAESALVFCWECLGTAPSTLEEVLAAADRSPKNVAAEQNDGDADASASDREEVATNSTA